MINSCVCRPTWVSLFSHLLWWEGLQSYSCCTRDLLAQFCKTAREVPRPGLVNERRSFAPFQTLSPLTVRRAWVVNSLSVRSTEYSSISSLEGCTSTHRADDHPDPLTVHLVNRLLPSQDMGIRQVASWHGEVFFGCFVCQEGWEKKLKALCLFFFPMQ